MQRKFASAAQCHSERRGHYWFGRVFQGTCSSAGTREPPRPSRPTPALCGQQNQHQIRADRKLFTLVRDDHGVEVRLEFRQSCPHHVHDVVADCICFAVKLAAEHSIAEVDQRGARIRFHNAAGALQIREHRDPGPGLQLLIIADDQIGSIRYAAGRPYPLADRTTSYPNPASPAFAARVPAVRVPRAPSGGPRAQTQAHPTARKAPARLHNPSAWHDRSRRSGRDLRHHLSGVTDMFAWTGCHRNRPTLSSSATRAFSRSASGSIL